MPCAAVRRSSAPLEHELWDEADACVGTRPELERAASATSAASIGVHRITTE